MDAVPKAVTDLVMVLLASSNFFFCHPHTPLHRAVGLSGAVHWAHTGIAYLSRDDMGGVLESSMIEVTRECLGEIYFIVGPVLGYKSWKAYAICGL